MKEQTVSLGTKIVAANEKLTSINMIDLFEMIAHPEPSLRNQTEVLRSIQRMDSAKYNLMKKSLPYFVCAHFDPDYRRKENFSSVSSFVLDIDHVDEKSIQLDELKAELAKDERIAMMFTSPSGCGLNSSFCSTKHAKMKTSIHHSTSGSPGTSRMNITWKHSLTSKPMT